MKKVITKYSILNTLIKKFKEGFFGLVIVISPGGLGKTYEAEKVLDGECLEINTHATPLGLYQTLYEHKDGKLIWFDDIDVLFNDPKLVSIMKQVCQTHTPKKIRWMTSKGIDMKDMDVPKEFEINSKVLLTCNDTKRLRDESVKALLTRSHNFQFTPSNDEIIKHIRDEFPKIHGETDEKIITKLIKKNRLNLRDYVLELELKNAGFSVG